MTKLSQELNECPLSTPELNGVIENNPIYVTSVPEIQNATLERIKKNKCESREQLGDKIDKGETGENQISPSNGHTQSILVEQDSHDQELELIQDIIEGKDVILSVPSSANTLSCEQQIADKTPKLTVHNHVEDKAKFTETVNAGDLKDKISTSGATNTTEKSAVMEFENGQHREMAVDVPDSFVAVTKTPPRYPPVKAGGISNDSLPRKRGEPPEPPVRSSTTPVERPTVQTPLESENKTVSEPESTLSTFHSRAEGDDDSISRTSKPSVIEVNGVPPDVLPTMTVKEEQLERIRKYQEDIRRRREEEERQALEEEFLRTSLRGSKKLQALESKPPLPPRRGVVNTAFELEEGDTGTLPAGQNVSPGRLVGDVEAGHEPVELTKIIDPPELLQSLYRLGSHLQGNGHRNEDLELVESVLRNTEFQKILDVHNKVQEIWCFGCPPTPTCCDAQDISQEVINSLQECSLPEAAELLDILSKFELEGLIYSHDKIGERQALPVVTPDEELLDRASQYTEESVKIVRIDKTNEPLGATVRNEGEAVIIGRIVKGGAAEKSGLLHEGDEILEVNGIEMRGKSVNDVCDILANMTGTLTFLIMPTQYEQKGLSRETVMHVKAHFDYDPDDDLYIPCRELGISFQKGDILHVINQEDPNWWQAYREGEEDQTLAGLIPSKSFQQQRETVKQTVVGEVNNREKSKKGKFLCAKKHHKKKKKKVMYQGNFNEDFDIEQILTYEEVALYYPRANRKRPIVLIGPPNIGRHELRQRLMEDTERFAAAVPHTSRSRRDTEVDGVDYHFITRSQFEADILGGRFVEHGEYEKNYYGTSLDAIRSVVNSGKICVLNLHPQSLKILKYSDLKPYVVFVAPPSLEKLRQNRLKMGASAKDEELKDIIEKAREMEENYGHYFDMVIINSDIDKAYNELLKEINILEREPQWVPSVWLKNETN